jgi:hypothetical protein
MALFGFLRNQLKSGTEENESSKRGLVFDVQKKPSMNP